MAQPTARDLIVDAFNTSGVRGLGQEVDADDTAVGLRFLNLHLIPQLRIQRLWSPSVSEYTFTTSNSKERYSVGFADPIPANPQPDVIVNQEIIQILQAQVNVGSVWVPLRQVSPEDYYRMTQNEQITNIPSQFMYNRSRNPFDELVFSNPTLSGYKVRLAVNGEVKSYELDDEINLASGMYGALLDGLGAKICKAYGFTQRAQEMTMDFSADLTRLKDVVGSPVPKLKLNLGGSRYNIISDTMTNSYGGL